jgi:hypothetical protein
LYANSYVPEHLGEKSRNLITALLRRGTGDLT